MAIRIIYDGSCSFCSAIARIARLLDWRGRIEAYPFQDERARTEAGVGARDARRSVFAVRGIEREHGPAAAAWIADELLPGAPRLFRSVQRLPLVRPASEAGYAAIERLRHRLPLGRPTIA